jgi:hypothetical protein
VICYFSVILGRTADAEQQTLNTRRNKLRLYDQSHGDMYNRGMLSNLSMYYWPVAWLPGLG